MGQREAEKERKRQTDRQTESVSFVFIRGFAVPSIIDTAAFSTGAPTIILLLLLLFQRLSVRSIKTPTSVVREREKEGKVNRDGQSKTIARSPFENITVTAKVESSSIDSLSYPRDGGVKKAESPGSE